MDKKLRAAYFKNYVHVPPDVIRAAVRGEPEAQQKVMERYSGYAKAIAEARTRKAKRKGLETSIEDILQTAWMGVFEDIKKFRGK